MISYSTGNGRDVGLLMMRIGLGVMFVLHGYPKILGGPEAWEKVGGAMQSLGISAAPALWGFLAGLAEFGGGVCLIFGILFQPACLFMFVTMMVALSMHLSKGDPFVVYSHAAEAGIVFASLILIGPGKYSLGKKD